MSTYMCILLTSCEEKYCNFLYYILSIAMADRKNKYQERAKSVYSKLEQAWDHEN